MTAQSHAPVGVGPGEVRCRLLAESPDFPLMVVSWAQLGYLTIHVNQDWAVTLHKRMDMGNERSGYENRLFRSLFGREQMADGAGSGDNSAGGAEIRFGRGFWARGWGCAPAWPQEIFWRRRRAGGLPSWRRPVWWAL